MANHLLVPFLQVASLHPGSSALLDSPSPAFKRQRTVMVQNDADGGSRVVAKSVRPATQMDFQESPIIGDRSGKRRRTSQLPAVFK